MKIYISLDMKYIMYLLEIERKLQEDIQRRKEEERIAEINRIKEV